MNKANPFFETAAQPQYLVVNRIHQQLKEVVEKSHTHNAVAAGIKACIDAGTPISKIIKEVKEMARDNYSMTAGIIGHHLLLTIVNCE